MSSAAPARSKPEAERRVNMALRRLFDRFAAELREELLNDRMPWPSIPSVLVQIRKVMQEPETGAQEVAAAVAADPALATRFLRMANSVYYSNGSPCDSLRAAVVRLGNDAVVQVTMMLTAARVFAVGQRRRIQPHLARLWRHSVHVAALSDVLSRPLSHLQVEVAALAGLIHDIGVLPIVVHAHKYPSVISNPNILEPLVKALHPRFGFTMLEQWRFPEQLVAVAAGHEELQRRGQAQADYVDVVLVANQLSHMDPERPSPESPLWRLPAFRKVGATPETLAETLSLAQERCELLNRLLQPAAR